MTQQEWESILTSILLEEDPPEDVETTAAVYAESEITVTFRKRVQGITVSLRPRSYDMSRNWVAWG